MKELIVRMEDNGQLTPVVEIVRCKDCKHRSEEMYDYYGNTNKKVYVCQIHDIAKRPDFFCADGEPREGDSNGR